MISWVDDILIIGEPVDMEKVKIDLHGAFECKSKGVLKDYVGSKIDILGKSNALATVEFTQPVLVQKLEDGYNLPSGKHQRHLQ